MCLLRPSRPLVVSFKTIYEPSRPKPGQLRSPMILNSRFYSESTPAPPPPKDSESTKGSQSSKHRDKNWSIPSWIAPSLGGAIATAGLGLVAYTLQFRIQDQHQELQRHEHQSARESAIYNTLRKGSQFRGEIDNIIPRDVLVNQVRMLITPSARSRLYPLIVGEHGTGMTSLIQLAVNNLEEPKGVVYVNVPVQNKSSIEFAEAMQQALGWEPDPVIDSDKPSSFVEVLRAFSRAAAKYKREYKRIPVLIIDNANKLAENQLELLEQLQDYAELAADEGTATFVFMSSEGHVPRRMMERSSWSRSGRILEIGDVTKSEALEYLKLWEIDDRQAGQLYELVGGRMVHLKRVADDIQSKNTLEDVRKDMFRVAESQLTIAEILPHDHYHKDGAAIINELLKKGSISNDAYFDLVGREVGNRLLETNVFAQHFESRQITFQSTIIARFCEQKLAYWKKT